jgi:ubiquinone/menaquinone biosynthesis C-methylase UbiE
MNEVRAFFDNDSSRYESMRYAPEYKDCHQFSYLARQAKVLELLPRAGNAVLDVGCGPGVYTRQLLDRGYRVSACDISPKMIEVASAKFSREVAAGSVQFHAGEIHDWDIPAQSFDAAISIGVISYVSNLNGFLARIASLLKPDGTAVFQISKKYSLQALDGQVIYPFLRGIKRIFRPGNRSVNLAFAFHRYRVRHFNSVCANAGLVLEEGVHFDYSLPLLSTFCTPLNLRFAEFMENRRRGVFPKVLAGDYIGRYRKNNAG